MKNVGRVIEPAISYSAKIKLVLPVLLCLAVFVAGTFALRSASSASTEPKPDSGKLMKALRAVRPQATQPISSQAVRFAETRPVSEIAKQPAVPAKEKGEDEESEAAENRSVKHPSAAALAEASVPGGVHKDPVAQTTLPAPKMPSPLVQFDGLSNSDNAAVLGGRVTPPDTDGYVGPNHYVQQINSLVRVWDKTGTALTSPFKLSGLFSTLGGLCSTTDNGDPIVLYDKLADRWMLSQFAFTGAGTTPPFHQCIAISKTGDPTGAYFAYDFVTAGNEFPDYPKLGVWPDGYYMMVHQFTFGGPFNGTGVYSFDRVKMLAGNPTASYIYFNRDLTNFPEGYGGLLPSDLDGINPPPAGRPNTFAYFTSLDFPDPADGLRLFDFHADFATPANSTFTERAETTYASPLPVAAFSTVTPTGNGGRRAVPQPSPATVTSAVDAITDRLMHRMQYRNQGGYETLVMNHTVGAPGSTTFGTFRAAPRYYELRSTAGGPFVVQEQATFAPADGISRWMASASEDNQGNLAIGYSVSSATTTFPGINYAGRLATDPPGGLAQGEATLIAGTGRQTDTTNNRWGDYSGMSMDPVDDCTFWYTQMYYTSASQATSGVGFLTRIGSFKFPTCTAPAKGTVHFTVTNCATSALIPNVSVSIDGISYGATLTNGTYDGTLAPGSHTYSVTKLGHSVATGNFSITNAQTTNVPVCLNSGVVHFIITDCATSNPISGAAVTVDGISYGSSAANGTFDGDATPGSHTYSISKLHYMTATGNFSITNGQITNQPVCLNGVADVSITKTADAGYVVAGSQVGFNVTLTNTGQTAATGLSVTDILPGGASTNWSVDIPNSDAGWSVSGFPTQSLVYSPTTLALGASTHVHVTSPTSAACAGTVLLSNTASFNTGNDGSGMASASVNVLCAPVSGGPVTVTASAGTPGPTDYPTVKAAFDAINAGTHQGAIVAWIFGNTTETVPAVLNATGTGSAVYASVLMLPSGGARTVSGAIAAGSPLIDLNGADNVSIDGVNSGGSSLTLSNTTVSATASTSTIRFIGGATNNAVKNCTILGSSSAAAATAGGNVFFSTSTVAGGNSNNTISNNNIGPAGANTPSKGVMGLGSASPNNNTGNVINGNNIFDYFLAGTGNTAGVSIQANNTNWTISNNRMYQTATRTFTGTAGVRYSGILVASSGNTFTVTGNTIGFGAANGTGTTTITGTGTGAGNEFRGIAFTNASTASYSTIQNNTISGINQTTNRAVTTTDLSAFCGIQSGSSATDAPANITGNTIGSLDGSSTIAITDASVTANATPIEGILDFNFVDAVTISNNNIGSITIGGAGTTIGFRGILVGSTTGVTHTLSNNIVGGTAAGSITDNLVGGYSMYGIQISTANGVATGNTIRNMTGNANGAVVTMSGIIMSGSTGISTVSRNTVHSLTDIVTGGSAGAIYAIDCSLPATGSVIERNLVHSINVTSTLTAYQIWGMVMRGQGSATYKNNMVRLGLDAAGNSITTAFSIIGMRNIAGSTTNYYFNSVYIGGTNVAAGGSNSFAFNSDVVTNARSFQDNIFWNARSNAVGGGTTQIAVTVGGTAPNPAGLSMNYNDLYASGTDGVVGLFNSVIQPTLADWRTATGQDANSISVNPQFLAPNGTAATGDLHIQNTSPVRFMGISIAGVTNDFDNDPRPATPAIGADEFIPGSCSFMLSPPDHQDFGAGGGSNTVTVTASDPKCTWTAVSNAAFITVDSGTPGLGSGVVGYTVAANTGPARSGTMTIAGMTFTVNQASGCTFMLSPMSQNFVAAGGSNSVGVTAGAGCAWTAVSNDAFITVNSGTPGNGNGTVGYTVAANTGPARMGTMTIAGITFTVTQDSGCIFTLSRNHQSFPASAGNGSVNVTANDQTCMWTASTTATYIHITSGTPGTGNGTLNYTIDANPGPDVRSDTITIAGLTYAVYQGIDFLDVPMGSLFYTEIGKLASREVKLGCGSGNFCPNDPILREQMAQFILRAKGEFNPPPPMTQRFNDVPPGNLFYNFIDRLAVLGITVGCTPDHLSYCPSSPVRRDEMSAFIMRGLSEFNPPPPMTQRFNDVPPANVFYNFVDRLAQLGITVGCTPDHLMYCPGNSVTRGEMAAFLVRAFDL